MGHMMCGERGGGMPMQMQVPSVPLPMACFAMALAFMLGTMFGMKKGAMGRGMGMGMGMGMGHMGKMGMHHHHHGFGTSECGCGQRGEDETAETTP